MTANASSSSAIGRLPDCPDDLPPLEVPRVEAPVDDDVRASRRPVDLAAREMLPPLPRAFLTGRDTDLLEPLRFLGADPTGGNELPGAFLQASSASIDRRALAAALGRANASYGHPRADELAATLAEPATRVVVTGQQPGLFGGPLMGLTKTVAALRRVAQLEAEGQKAVAVFWIATEDHDYAEVARATLAGPDGPETLSLADDPSPLLPVGMRTFGDSMKGVAERAPDLLGGSLAAQRLDEALRWYRPDTRFGEAFARYLVHILGSRAPLFLDSMLPEVKRAQAPWLRRLVEERHAIDDALARQHARVEERGHDLQVQPQPGLSPLFFLHAREDDDADDDARATIERRRIEWRGDDRWGLRGLDGFERPVDELLRIIDENPSAVTPGVLARPAIQDAILGTSLQILGPSETSYMAQASAVHRVLGVDGVWTSLRPQTLILDSRQTGYLDELGVDLDALLHESVETLVARRLGSDPVAVAASEVDRVLCRLRQPVLDVDGSLETPWRKTRDSIRGSLEKLAKKTTAAIARRHEVWANRLEQLQHLAAPGGSLQERVYSLLFFHARYGDALVDAMLERLDLDPRTLAILEVDP